MDEKINLRDQFAIKAMQSMLSDEYYRINGGDHRYMAVYIADDAYNIADHMLKEREKNNQTKD